MHDECMDVPMRRTTGGTVPGGIALDISLSSLYGALDV